MESKELLWWLNFYGFHKLQQPLINILNIFWNTVLYSCMYKLIPEITSSRTVAPRETQVDRLWCYSFIHSKNCILIVRKKLHTVLDLYYFGIYAVNIFKNDSLSTRFSHGSTALLYEIA